MGKTYNTPDLKINRKKICSALTPTWKQLFGINMPKKDGYWRNVLWSSRTSVSMRLIFESYQIVKGKRDVYLWLPEYFCAETIADFMVDGLHLVSYPITNTFEPDWNTIKAIESPVDMFIHVHFFGECIDISKTRSFCDKNEAILIEDCAHALYDYGKIGKKGDFSLFSPHKLLPVFDGGIIKYNKDNVTVSQIVELLTEKLTGCKKNIVKTLVWKLKKTIQKVFKISQKTELNYEPHILERKSKRETQEKISSWSQKTINGYSYEELKKIAYDRKENRAFVDTIIAEIDPDVVMMTTEQNECPFFAVYSLKNVADPKEAIERIKHIGLAVSFWPSLSSEGSSEKLSSETLELSKNLIVIPVPQTLSIMELAKKISSGKKNSLKGMGVRHLQDSAEDKKDWETVLRQCQFTNVTQDWTYAEAKNKAQHWRVNRYIITENNVDIGAVQVLFKSIGTWKIAARVNHGPLFIDGKQTIENEVTAIEMIRKSEFRCVLFFYVPFSFMNVENYSFMVQHGWINWNRLGFPSGIVSLKKTKEELMSSLDSKWRNQLKKALKCNLTVRTDSERYEEMLEIYQQDQESKQFDGVDDHLIRTMFTLEDVPVRVFYVTDESNNIMAFDIFYQHINTATYYIGWNSVEGRALCLNNLLLYTAAETFLQEGLSYLDLGGIEPIYTEKIAKFKDGMKPKKYRHMGEFLKGK